MRGRTAHPSSGFTLVELLVVIGLIALLVAILLPALLAAKERANRIKCASNLHQIDLALRTYALDNKGQYPRTAFDDSSLLSWFYHWEAPDPFRWNGVNDITSGLYLLIRLRMVPPGVFVCPSTSDRPEPSVRTHYRFGDLPLTERSNFYTERQGDWLANETLSYGWVTQYVDGYMPRDYRPPPHGPPDWVVAADRNDCVDRFRSLSPKASSADMKAMNSRNHGGAGQNVLYNDGSVAWRSTPFCGHDGDNIYTPADQRVLAPYIPRHRYDTIVLPQLPAEGTN